MGASKKEIDWEAVERDYRAGKLSIRAIADAYGCSDTAIRKRAKKDGWNRALSEKVQQRVQDELVREQVRAVRSGNARAPISDEEVIQHAAQLGVDIIMSHRKDIRDGRQLCKLLMDTLKASVLTRDEIEEWIEAETETSGKDGEPDMKRRERMMAAISLPSFTGSMRNLSQALNNLIRLERQAYSLDEDGNHSSYEDDLEKLQ